MFYDHFKNLVWNIFLCGIQLQKIIFQSQVKFWKITLKRFILDLSLNLEQIYPPDLAP